MPCPRRWRRAGQHIVENLFEQNPAVHHGIEADSAGQADLVQACFLTEPSCQVQADLLGAALERGGNVLVVLSQLSLRMVARDRMSGGTSD